MSYNAINPFQTFRDSTGEVRANGIITFYKNRTTTLAAIYSDEALKVAQTNPYTLDAFGRIRGDVKFTDVLTMKITNADLSDVRTDDDVASLKGSSIITTVATKAAAAALTLVSGDAGRKVFVTSDDGGEFTVRYDVTAPYADNGGAYCGTVFIPTGGDGTIGIVRTVSGAVNTKWFGVITSNSAAANSTAIQLAINSIHEYIFTEEGEYDHNGFTFPTPAYKDFSGAGKGLTIFTRTDTAGAGLEQDNSAGSLVDSELNLHDFTLNGGKTPGVDSAISTHKGLVFKKIRRLTLSNVIAKGFSDKGYYTDFVVGANIYNSSFKDNIGRGVYLYGVNSGAATTRHNFHGCTTSGNRAGAITIENGEGNRFMGGTITSNGYSGAGAAGYGGTVEIKGADSWNNKIEGNLFEFNWGYYSITHIAGQGNSIDDNSFFDRPSTDPSPRELTDVIMFTDGNDAVISENYFGIGGVNEINEIGTGAVDYIQVINNKLADAASTLVFGGANDTWLIIARDTVNAQFIVRAKTIYAEFIKPWDNETALSLAGKGTQGVDMDDDLVVADGKNINFNISTGSQLGTSPSQKMGFWGATPSQQLTITGSKGGNAALTDLLTKLATLGIIVDSTS